MKWLCILLFGILATTSLGAQDNIPVQLSKYQLRLGILEPSLMFEVRLADHQSIVASSGLNLLPSSESVGDEQYIEGTYLHPYLRGELRNYYSRKRVKKELKLNSGNYIAIAGGYYFDGITFSRENEEMTDGISNYEQSYFIGPIWGIQRNYQSGIHLGLSLGAGYTNGKNRSGEFWPICNFTFGFLLLL